MILNFAQEVSICDVSAAVSIVLQSQEQITYNGLVTQIGVYATDACQQVRSIQSGKLLQVSPIKLLTYVCLLCHTAICGISAASDISSVIQLPWKEVDLDVAMFCATKGQSEDLDWFV